MSYGINGNLTSISAPGGESLSFAYDGRLPKEQVWSGSVPGKVSYSYNNDFMVSGICLNALPCVSYGYDQDGLLTSAGSITLEREAQKAGLVKATSLDKIATSQSYTGYGELDQFESSYQTNGLFSASYSRDLLGKITSKTETINGEVVTESYTYNDAGRLASVTRGAEVTSYEYDGNGNRLSKVKNGVTESGVYDAQDRLKSYAGNSYSYSANGELESKTDVDGNVSQYHYDVLGNLISASVNDGNSTTSIDYVIDGSNRRIGKKIDGVLVQGFLYADQLNPVAELDGQGNLVTQFVYGSKINVPDYMVKNGVKYRIISDHLGSPRLVVNAANGQIAQRMDFDEFGNVTRDTNPGFQPFGFAGGIYDRDTRLTRFGARDYDAEAGRWTAKDPIRFAGGDSNIYGYVFSDPVNWVDPSGNFAIVIPLIPLVLTGTDVLIGGGLICLFTNCPADIADTLEDLLNQFDEANNASDAPGCPTGGDGYKPPKNWDGKKRPSSNGGGYGYPDSSGNIWIPTGPNGHGGPHWDVQRPGGGYVNVYPGGRTRGGR